MQRTITFSDNRIISIHYKEEEYKIVWDKPETEEIWAKGKKFVQSPFYSDQGSIIKAMKAVKHQTKKISN